LLKRSKTDDEIDHEAAGSGDGGVVLVVNEDQDACELVARLVEWAGYRAVRSHDVVGVVDRLADEPPVALIVDSLGTGIATAFKVLDDVRADGPDVKETPVIILAATDTNRLFAYQSGVDGYVVRPFHADELVEALRAAVDRSPSERFAFRQAQLLGGATAT
jgi:DNA-binding response OmpR family regulator